MWGLEPEVAALKGHLEALLLSIDRPIRPKAALGLIPEEKTEPSEVLTLTATANPPQSRRRRPRPLRRGESAERDRRTPVAALERGVPGTGRAFRIERIAGGLRLLTLPAFSRPRSPASTRTGGRRGSPRWLSKLSPSSLTASPSPRELSPSAALPAGEVPEPHRPAPCRHPRTQPKSSDARCCTAPPGSSSTTSGLASPPIFRAR